MLDLFENFQLWKLETVADYINLALFLVVFVSAVALLTRGYRKRRNDHHAARRVCRRLGRLCGRKALVHPHARIVIGADTIEADGILAVQGRVYLLRCIGWGTTVRAGSGEREWKLMHGTEGRKIDNPLPALRQKAQTLQAALLRQGCRAEVLPLVVFADNFSRPVVHTDVKETCTTYHELGNWYQEYIKRGDKCESPQMLVALLRAHTVA